MPSERALCEKIRGVKLTLLSIQKPWTEILFCDKYSRNRAIEMSQKVRQLQNYQNNTLHVKSFCSLVPALQTVQ